MESGVFARKLRELNPELRIWCGDDDSKPAGLFIVKQNEYTEICGVDKNEVPEFTVWENNRIKKGGWRRTLKILLQKKLINKDKAERVFRFNFERRKANRPRAKSPGEKLMEIQARVAQIGG